MLKCLYTSTAEGGFQYTPQKYAILIKLYQDKIPENNAYDRKRTIVFMTFYALAVMHHMVTDRLW